MHQEIPVLLSEKERLPSAIQQFLSIHCEVNVNLVGLVKQSWKRRTFTFWLNVGRWDGIGIKRAGGANLLCE